MNLRKFWMNHPNKDLVPYITFYNRVKNGLTPEDSMSPYRIHKKKTIKSDKPKSLLKFYKEHKNPDNITYTSFINHVKEGYSLEEAMYRKSRFGKPGTLLAYYKSHPNNKIIALNTYYKRINRGASKEEAMEINDKKTQKDIFLETNNPFNIPYSTFINRIKKGMTPEEAMSSKRTHVFEENKLLNFYRSHPNMKHIKYNTFKARVNRYGRTMEEAMELKFNKKPKESSKPIYIYWKNYKGEKVKFAAFKYRVETKGMSWEEAIVKPLKEKSEMRKYCESINDPNKVKFDTFRHRVKKKKMSWEEAVITPPRGVMDSDYGYWKKHRNGKGQPSFNTFLYKRINMGLSLEESVQPGRLKRKEKK